MPRNTPAYEGEKKDFPSILRKLMEKDYKDKHGKKDSQEALAKETLKALRGQRTIHTYDGIPPFDGFDFIEE